MTNTNTLISILKKGTHPLLKELYGQSPINLKNACNSYINIITDFKKEFDHSTASLFSAPGRTEIGGNHTDHNYGRVLAGAVNLDNIAVANINKTEIINIRSLGYPEFKVDLKNLTADASEKYTSASLVRGICARFKELGFNIGGFDACIDGRVPKGSGLSSSASFEVLIGGILNHLFNNGKIDAVKIAQIGQYAENNFFGKPCGLMDQTACSVGGLITIDFKDPSKPIVKKVKTDLSKSDYALIITDTGGNHANLNDEYAALPAEMKSVAKGLKKEVLREVTLDQVIQSSPILRKKVSDRALLRAIHFQCENDRVVKQVKALESKKLKEFLSLIIESGNSSYMYNQNIFPCNNVKEQGVSLALALSEIVLKRQGAWRVHGGGFAGTIQAFVPKKLIKKYIDTLEHLFGKGACHLLSIRTKGTIKLEL